MNNVLVLDEIIMNIEEQSVMFGDEEISFTNQEFQVFSLLLMHPRRVYSKAQIYMAVTDSEKDSYHAVEITISRIRKKLRHYTNKDYIHVIRGRGYKLVP